MSSKIALIFGYGARVGTSVAAKLASSGYSVAVVSRSATPGTTPEGYLSIKADVSDPASIPSVFETVKSTLKSAPTVVVYNAASLTPPPDENSVLSVPVERFVNDLQINTVSAYAAAQESLKGFDPAAEAKGVFIYTGNGLNSAVLPVPVFLTLGVGKSASAHWVGLADALYAKQGYR
jgi:NAD(P)-dependent dehydrogenase (short-subunit alcohol dehydrogenase family)